MFYNEWMLEQLAQEHRRDLMRQLEHDRLIREAEPIGQQQGHRLVHLLDWIGRRMVCWGERMQARHALYHTQSLTHITRG